MVHRWEQLYKVWARKVGAAIVDDTGRVVWAEALPPGTSAQKASVTQALERAKGKKITIYTDSRYAFSTVHIQGPIYKEQGFSTAEGKEIKNLPEIRRLLAAVHLPRAVSIVHVPGHQKGEDARARGNCAADAAAHEAAAGDHEAHILTVGLPPPGMGTLPPSPIYSPSDLRWVQDNTTCPVGENGCIGTKMTTCCSLPTWANISVPICIKPPIWERKRL